MMMESMEKFKKEISDKHIREIDTANRLMQAKEEEVSTLKEMIAI